jgi:glycosyltransferase involved in cell wall biosynthesis
VSERLRVLLYSPANLNLIDGSSIWVQSVAETLHLDERLEITLPLKAPERRDVITGSLRRLERVELLEPRDVGGRRGPADELRNDHFLDLLERLDAERRFDVILLRSFRLCLAASQRSRLRGRIWSCYVLEPGREIGSARHQAELTAIAEASRYLVAQSEEMRAVLEAAIPAARGRTILLPPAIPPDPVSRPDPARVVERLLYTGKFHPFYAVEQLIEEFRRSRAERPGLEFHLAGDKIHRPRHDPRYAAALERLLLETDGLVWHGGLARDDVSALLARGGVALSVWDKQQGHWLNDLVVSTKLLDYCSVGLPVVLSRTPAQEAMLGLDYPLFVTGLDEVGPLLRRLFSDADLYRAAGQRTWQASRRFTYPAVHARLAPFLPGGAPEEGPGVSHAERAQLDRPKLPGSRFNVGLLDASPERARWAQELVAALRRSDERYRLVEAAPPAGLAEVASWLRTVGHVVGGRREAGDASAVALERALAAGSRVVPEGPPSDAAAAVLVGAATPGEPAGA